MIRIIYILVFFLWILNSYAWNAEGHKIVAQIAYDNLSQNAKRMCDKYLQSPADKSLPSRFVASSIWMDQLRSKEIYWFDAMHYIDTPFSTDETSLPSVESTNAVWAIKNAIKVLSSKKATTSDKRFALRMLIHVVGDLHQPLHAVTRVNAQLPKGDLGGNLFPMGKNSSGHNLHQYWDNGAGYFLGHYDATQLKKRARHLEEKWPCASINTQIRPERWARHSYKLAVDTVYQLKPYEIPSKVYQGEAKLLVQKQVVFAGCRLAALLNKTAQT